MTLLERRRMMLQSGGAEETWDYEWSYEDGLPDNNGLTKTTSGTASATLTSTGVKMVTQSYNAYVRYEKEDAKKQIGVMEATFYVHLGLPDQNGQARFCFSNGTKGVQIIANNGAATPDACDFYIYDAEDVANRTLLAPCVSDREYTVRVVLDGSVGKIYIDGVLVANNVNISTVLYSSRTAVWWQGPAYSGNYLVLRSVKLKYNRT